MSVSLCLIARDEADCLARCLESAREVAGEIIVVDTGSTDGTPDIARAYGARVFHLAWTDDFAAARNHALEQAGGDWILVLDADEVLEKAPAGEWEKLLRDAGAGGYFVTIRNHVEDGAPATDQVVRLFRNEPEHRFRGAIHEQVAGAILTAGRELKHCGLVINHYGYLRGRIAAKDKYRRNVAVIGRALAAAPGDPFLLYSLGTEHLLSGDPETAIPVLQRALPLMTGGEGYFRDALTHLGTALLRSGRLEELQSHLASCLRMFPEDPGLHLQKGLLAMARERYGEAVPHLRLALAGDWPERGHLLALLGDACDRAGFHEEAGKAYLAALGAAPERIYPLTRLLGLKRRGCETPGWEEWSRFTCPESQVRLAGILAGRGETALALVLHLLAVVGSGTVDPGLAHLLDRAVPAGERQATVYAYLRACVREMVLMGGSGAVRRLAAGGLELVAGELWPPPAADGIPIGKGASVG